MVTGKAPKGEGLGGWQCSISWPGCGRMGVYPVISLSCLFKFCGFFFFLQISYNSEKGFKKSEGPPSLLPSDLTGNALLAAAAGGTVCLRMGRVSALKPHHQTSLFGPSHSDTSGWPQASFLYSRGPLCFSGGSVFPARSPSLSQRPGGSGFCFLSDTLPCGLLQMNPVEDREMREYLKCQRQILRYTAG